MLLATIVLRDRPQVDGEGVPPADVPVTASVS
jgi:hypothetical protein